MQPPDVHTLEARTHGRVLVRRPSQPRPWPLAVGFHGYAEDAETHLAALQRVPGMEAWLLVSVQALHPFYTRSQRIVANWMTSQDRDLAIADNVDYVGRVLAWVEREYGPASTRLFSGFSQGGAMAYRAAATYGAAGLLIVAADVPPDVAARPDVTLPPVLLVRGAADQWYTEEKHAADLRSLASIGAAVESHVHDGGHEWTDDVCAAAARFIRGLRP
jgi:predicted esterase